MANGSALKGLILSGGKGSRLRPFTYTGAKQLVPIANRPVLFYAIQHLVDAGITDIGIVVGETGDQVRTAVGDGSAFGARVTYIEQPKPLGIAHGIIVAREFLAGDPFVLFLGDNFLRGGIAPLVERFRDDNAASYVLLCPVPNPREFGIAELADDGRLLRVVEKPSDPVSNLAVIGIYLFDSRVHEAVSAIRPSARGELEITDTIQYLLDAGMPVRAHLVEGSWIDTGKMDDILQANRLMLDDVEPRIDGSVDEASSVQGKVLIGSGASIVNSVVRGPAVIGNDTRISNSYIGPFTCIDHGCIIEDSEISGSVVMEHTSIRAIGHRIEDSLIGRYVELAGGRLKPRGYRLVLGDHSKVEGP
ncbi:MAG TPA: glucose-1-phosphate thymidylyltransferase [Dehalococcoidia bacterium]|nr:glucose-1-phosphate thymidylyltransferase [Dehalococcoidia bacterium]